MSHVRGCYEEKAWRELGETILNKAVKCKIYFEEMILCY